MSVIICGFVKLLFILYVKIYLSPGLEIKQELQAYVTLVGFGMKL